MLTRSDDYVAYCRETAKRARDPHDLALRGGDAHEITRATYERIAEVTGLNANDELLDIGCGDGTLLRMAKRIGAYSAVGLLATDEEVAIVRQMNLDVRQGFTHQLPLSDSSA